MRKLATFLVAAAALALVLVTLSPSTADAGWRKRGWGGPGVNVYVAPGGGWYGPRYGYYAPRYYRPYRYSYGYGYPYAYYPYWRSRYWRGWY